MLHRLGTIGMCDKLRLAGDTIWMFDVVGRSTADRGGIGRYFPLRHPCRQLYIVILLAIAIPLCDPACGQRRRSERGAVTARRCWACHLFYLTCRLEGFVQICERRGEGRIAGSSVRLRREKEGKGSGGAKMLTKTGRLRNFKQSR